MTMTKPVNRSLSNVVKKRLLCFSIALLLCILAYVYQSMSGTGTGRSFAANIPANTVSGVVFNDANGNGKLDAHEVGIGGVTVHLYHTDGTLAGTAITNAQGEYTFPTTPNDDYQIRLDNAADYTTGPLNGDQLTTVQSALYESQIISRAVLPDDSKLVGPENYPQIAVDRHASDQNEHNFDAGFIPTTSNAVANGDDPWEDLWCDCWSSSPEKPTTGSKEPTSPPTTGSKNPAPTKVKPTTGSKSGQVTTIPGSKKTLSVPPTTYPNLPSTGSNPDGYPLP